MSKSPSTVDHTLQSVNLPSSDAQVTHDEDQIEMALNADTDLAARAHRHPEIIQSAALDEALPLAAAELQRQDQRFAQNNDPKVVNFRAVPSDDSLESELVHDEENLYDLATDMAQNISRSRHLMPLIARSFRSHLDRSDDAKPHKSSATDDMGGARDVPNSGIQQTVKDKRDFHAVESRVAHVDDVPNAKTRKPVSWLTIRNIQWSDAFYDEMRNVLRHGVPQSKSERNQIIKKLNSKRFFEYVPFFSLQNDEIVLVDHDLPLWALDKHGRQVAHVDLPILYVVVKKHAVHAYLTKIFSHLAENGYRCARSFYRKVAMKAIGISHADVDDFIKHQEVAQVQANIFSKAPGLVVQPIRSESVMQIWECDLIDVARFAGSNNHVHYLLTVCDHFSKMGFVVPLKTKESERVSFELQLLFLKESAPQTIICDNGGEFRSAAMDELAKRWNIKMKHGLPYKSNSTGLIERFNRTLQTALKGWMLDYGTNRFLDVLPMLVYSYNVSIHSTHGYSPFLVHRGRTPRAIHHDWQSFHRLITQPRNAVSDSQSIQESPDPSVKADEEEEEQKKSDLQGSANFKPLDMNVDEQEERKQSGIQVRTQPVHERSQGLDSQSVDNQDQAVHSYSVLDTSVEIERQLRADSSEPLSMRAPAMAQSATAKPNFIPDVQKSHSQRKPSVQEDEIDEVNPDEVRKYVEATMKVNAAAQNQVAERINIKADKMIASTARRFAQKKNPRLKQNDHVRLDLLALTDHRKDAKSGFKKALNVSNWSKDVYRVQQRIDATATIPDLYVVVDSAGNPPEHNRRNAYYRYQLLLVEDHERLDKLHDVSQKPDFNFGVLTAQRHSVQRSPDEAESVGDDVEHEHFEKDTLEAASPSRPFRQAASQKSAKGWYASYH